MSLVRTLKESLRIALDPHRGPGASIGESNGELYIIGSEMAPIYTMGMRTEPRPDDETVTVHMPARVARALLQEI